ncbi:MAG: nitroreductase family protein [Muribaculaceae bacterium]|nr:nitroreductase family protein [Muribaculaceae bacterium]
MERYKQFMQLAGDRYSCRSYSDRPVAPELVDALVEAVRIAPSACNRQPWRLMVIDSADSAGRAAVAAAYARPWVETAPVYIIVCGEAATAWHRPYDDHSHLDVDLAIATQQLCLAATALGLGSCWICHFDPARLIVDLGLPSGIVPMAIIPVGYPADATIPEKKRKSTDEILLKR